MRNCDEISIGMRIGPESLTVIPGRALRFRRPVRVGALLLLLATVAPGAQEAAAQSAETLYTRALGRERQIRESEKRATPAAIRSVVRAYEAVVRRFPRSGYCDNALWQAANLSALAFERFGDATDKRTAARLFHHLRSQYPASSLARRVEAALQSLDRMQTDAVAAAPAPAPSSAGNPAARSAGPAPAAEPARASGVVTIRDVTRTELPDGVRVTIEMDGESLYRSERLENPSRVFFDFKGARTTLSLRDATIAFGDELVREIRFGRHPENTTRVVMELAGVESYSTFTLYDPFRVIVDFRRVGASAAAVPTTGRSAALRLDPPLRVVAGVLPSAHPRTANDPATLESANPEPVNPRSANREPADRHIVSEPVVPPAAREPVPMVARATLPELAPPAAPSANANGHFSIARQLGLGISRIVLDAGHGGHDPGARANGLSEAELVLDVTLRLRDLLEKEPDIEVTLTRDRDVFVPLEERTALANRMGADLFLSIHANASRNLRARGIETYFLNFASNPEAEAVAARENSGSRKTMHSLPEIVKAIALNNKIDESRDFAAMVQKSMVKGLSARNKEVRDLGVKQAPFVVLIGAGMPSVLAEISFVTNRAESALLKTSAYRQQIAESLLDAILRYQRSLKGSRAVALRE